MSLLGTVIVGGVLSATVTGKLALARLPCASITEQVMLVVPIGNVLPEAGVHVGAITPSTLSIADTTYAIVAPLGPVASAVIGLGTTSTGGVMSETVTVKLATAELPAASRAVHRTDVAPSGKVLPDAGVHATATGPSTSSIADTA